MKLEFSDRFWKNTEISNFMKIHPVVAELLRVDGWTDRQTDRYDEANSHFLPFGKLA